jgi:hypothetical protein
MIAALSQRVGSEGCTAPYSLLGRSAIFSILKAVTVVISPEPFIQKCRSLARAKELHLEVKDGRVRLAWRDDGATVFMERAEVIGLGISYDMLLEGFSETGGTIVDGRYPINHTLKERLEKLLKVRYKV